MLRIGKPLAIFGFALLLPVVASAQAAISGVVRDTSGAVLPGVTVEATSPALIEKVRVTVTDGTGQYAIENLRPGTYAVTYTLPGFAVVRRDEVQLQGTFNARINAELPVSALEEKITVTGETPVVDIQSTRQQRVMDREVLDTIPSSGLRTSLAALIPGVDFERQDVGGAGTRAVTGGPTVHGSLGSGDTGTTLNGISISSFGVSAGTSTIFMNPMAIEEVQIDTGSNSADLHAGGVRANYVPKEGGNAFSGVVFGAYAPGELQSDNLTDELIARGLATPNNIKANWDINPGFGGPIMRDRIWFYFAALQRDGRLRGRTFLQSQHQQSRCLDVRARHESPGMERAEAAGHAGPRDLAGRSTEQGGLHLVRHHLLLLPDRCRPHALLGSRHTSRVPAAAFNRG